MSDIRCQQRWGKHRDGEMLGEERQCQRDVTVTGEAQEERNI